MWEYNYTDELYHHGVKGQKWGVRRYQNKDGTLTPKGRAKLLADARKYEAKANTSVAQNYFARSRKARLTQKAKDARSEVRRSDLLKAKNKIKSDEEKSKKSVKEMSDAELRERINRLDLEKRYSELTRNPKQVSKGKKFIEDVITTSSKNIATQTATYLMGTMVNKMAKDTIVNPKKGQKDK